MSKSRWIGSSVTMVASRAEAVPVLPLIRLPTGVYTCQINLIDENGHKFGFQRAEIKVLPASSPAAPAAAAPKAGF